MVPDATIVWVTVTILLRAVEVEVILESVDVEVPVLDVEEDADVVLVELSGSEPVIPPVAPAASIKEAAFLSLVQAII